MFFYLLSAYHIYLIPPPESPLCHREQKLEKAGRTVEKSHPLCTTDLPPHDGFPCLDYGLYYEWGGFYRKLGLDGWMGGDNGGTAPCCFIFIICLSVMVFLFEGCAGRSFLKPGPQIPYSQDQRKLDISFFYPLTSLFPPFNF